MIDVFDGLSLLLDVVLWVSLVSCLTASQNMGIYAIRIIQWIPFQLYNQTASLRAEWGRMTTFKILISTIFCLGSILVLLNLNGRQTNLDLCWQLEKSQLEKHNP